MTWLIPLRPRTYAGDGITASFSPVNATIKTAWPWAAQKGLFGGPLLVTILETGRAATGPLSERHPRYPDMFAALLSQADKNLRFRTVALVDGEGMPDPASCEAVVITGSAGRRL